MPLFKNAIAYRISPEWVAPSQEKLEEALQRHRFLPCGPTDLESAGWVPPRGEDHAPLAESISGQVVLKLSVERKAVPSGAVKAELEARCKAIEAEVGKKPGRKQKLEMKEDIVHEFLPRAFSKRSSHVVWLDVANRVLVVGAGSYKAADRVVNTLIELMTEVGHALVVAQLSTEMSPSAAMAYWLTEQEAPQGFSVDRELELKNFDDSRACVRYARHDLELEEIIKHIEGGKVPTHLAMTWAKRLSFVLTADLVIRKIETLDVATDEGGVDGFDADVTIVTSELSKLIPDLLLALGGETATPSTAVKS